MGQIEIDPIDDTEVNGDRSLLLTLTPDPALSVLPFLVTVNESVVIIEDDDALGELWGRNGSMRGRERGEGGREDRGMERRRNRGREYEGEELPLPPPPHPHPLVGLYSHS
jgi:hypothetical protein